MSTAARAHVHQAGFDYQSPCQSLPRKCCPVALSSFHHLSPCFYCPIPFFKPQKSYSSASLKAPHKAFRVSRIQIRPCEIASFCGHQKRGPVRTNALLAMVSSRRDLPPGGNVGRAFRIRFSPGSVSSAPYHKCIIKSKWLIFRRLSHSLN